MSGQLLRRDPVVQAHPSTLNFYGESNYSRLFKEMNVRHSVTVSYQNALLYC